MSSSYFQSFLSSFCTTFGALLVIFFIWPIGNGPVSASQKIELGLQNGSTALLFALSCNGNAPFSVPLNLTAAFLRTSKQISGTSDPSFCPACPDGYNCLPVKPEGPKCSFNVDSASGSFSQSDFLYPNSVDAKDLHHPLIFEHISSPPSPISDFFGLGPCTPASSTSTCTLPAQNQDQAIAFSVRSSFPSLTKIVLILFVSQ